jgi:hypothetical protein
MTEPMNEQFVIVFEDNTLALAYESRVSNMFDMADCDAMKGVAGIYAADENGDLVKVTVGPVIRTDGWELENSVSYGHAPIMAGSRQVGFVHLTDH